MIKVNKEIIELNRFPDSTLNIKGNPTLNNGIVVLSWHYDNDSEFMAIAFLTKYYQARNNKVILYMPYVPNARMDRVETPEDIMTIKYFGKLINSLNFYSVYVMDVHSSATLAAINNCQLIENDYFINTVFDNISKKHNEYPIVFFPDEGAMKRYSKKIKNCPFAFGIKNRDWRSGEIINLEISGLTSNEIKGKNILIQDDICSKGGTFYYAAKKLKELGAANIYLAVSHCENNIHKGEFGNEKVNLLNTGLIKKVFTTNSTYSLGESDMVSVIDVSDYIF